MRLTFRLLILLLLLSAPGLAAEVTVAWDASPSSVTGYKMYLGLAEGVYTSKGTVSKDVLQFTFKDLTPGLWYFTVTAFDDAGNESDYATSRDEPTKRYVTKLIAALDPPAFITMRVEALSQATILNVSVTSITTTTAGISWTTKQECSGTVFWGLTNILDKTSVANNLGTTEHFFLLTGLKSRTHYYYKVSSVCSGVAVDSGVRTFNTK